MTSASPAARTAEPRAAEVAQTQTPPVASDVVEHGSRRALIVAGVMMAALLQTLDATIVNVALPTIEGNIGASIDDGTWIITGYIISNVVAIPLAPFGLARFGRRAYYATCIIGFTAASFFCGTATTLGGLVFFRVVQGAFGGGLIATSQIVLRDTFGPERAGTSSALFAIALTLGPALGPTLGGILTDNASWQWVFDINIVPGFLAATIVLTTLRNPLLPQRLPFDLPGVALLIAALGSLQYVLDEGERNYWFDDAHIVGFTASCVAGFAAFVLWELFGTKRPIVDLRIFRHRNVASAVPTSIFLGMVVFGPIVLMPQYVQNVLGFTATEAGLLILMRALPVMLLTPLVARIATRFDARIIISAGFIISGASFWIISEGMTTSSNFATLAWPFALSGIGQSLLLVPLLVSVLASVPPADAPKTSSFIALSVQLGGSIASTALITVFDRRTYFHSDVYRAAATLHNPTLVPFAHLSNARVLISRLVQGQAVNAGFADALLMLVPAACAALVPVWLSQRRRGAPPRAR